METIKDVPNIIAFLKVAEHQSFSKAALEMGVSKSLLSKSVRELEEKFGKALLKRTTRTVEFTSFGKQYFDLCQGHFNEIERITKQAEQVSEVPHGKLRITLAGAYGEDHIAPLISRVLLRYPGISAELVFSEEIVDIEKGDFDIAIRVSGIRPKDGRSVQISSRKEYLCATESFLNRFGTPQKPSDLKKFNCLIGSNSLWFFNDGKKEEKIKVAGNFKTTNGRALAAATLQGLGISKLPAVYVRPHLQQKRLVTILSEYTQRYVPIWAVVPAKSKTPLPVRLILDELTTVS